MVNVIETDEGDMQDVNTAPHLESLLLAVLRNNGGAIVTITEVSHDRKLLRLDLFDSRTQGHIAQPHDRKSGLVH